MMNTLQWYKAVFNIHSFVRDIKRVWCQRISYYKIVSNCTLVLDMKYLKPGKLGYKHSILASLCKQSVVNLITEEPIRVFFPEATFQFHLICSIKGKRVITYEGERTAQDIVQFAEKANR